MQTLEINFKAVFENLPGKNVLLLPDSPFFTIAAITNTYSKAVSIKRKETVGKAIAEVFMNKFGQSATKTLLDSLEHILISKEPHSVIISSRDRDHIKVKHIPVLSSRQEVLYIIHTLTPSGGQLNPLLRDAEGELVGSPGDIADEPNLYAIIMQSPVAMGILRGEDMVLETANAPLLELWGKTSEIIGLPILKALPEIVKQPFPQLLQNVYETGIEYLGFETEAMLIRNGVPTTLYFNYVYSPIKNHLGAVTGIMMIAADVSNLVRAKKELEESEKRYRDLILNADVATAVYIGEAMEIKLANDAMLRLWGKDYSVIGKPLRKAVPELNGQPFLELLDKVYKTGMTYYSSEDKANLIVNGQLQSFYFNFTYKALRDTSGRIYGIVNMAVDVSEIVKAKLKINDTEERWRIALNSAELGTWDFYPLIKKLICSARTKELFGLSKDAPATFDQLLEAIHFRDRAKVQAEIQKVLKAPSQSSYWVEYEVIGIEDKRSRWQRATGQAFFDGQGIAYRLTGTVMDITERKRIEEALEERVNLRTIELLDANKELERSNHELEQYAYVASHDLQEPLRKILVYTDLLKNGKENLSEVNAARLEKVISSAKRMSHLIKDLLNFSRLLKTESIFSLVDLNQIILNVLEDFELKIRETGAVVNVGVLPSLEASPQQMNQLFYNLIGNALKFRKEEAAPVISIHSSVFPREKVETFSGLNPSLSYCDLCVADNGIGFNPKYMKHIFEIFKRLHTPIKFEGTGIGLALCRKIARNHRGEIYAESTEGKGAVFHVILPLKQNAAEDN